MNLKPVGNKILVEPLSTKEKSDGGIYIPEKAQEKPQEYKVLALGTGNTDEDGNVIPFNVKIGDTVLVGKYNGADITIDYKNYKILIEEDILAVVETI